MIKQMDWQGTVVHVLENDVLIVSICPEIGNNVYSIWDKKLQREMLRTPESPAALAEQFVQFGTPILMPPNRIHKGQFQFDGRDYQLDITQPATGNHIHGVVRQQPWKMTQAGENETGQLFITSVLRLAEDEHVQSQYPHALELEITYTLDGGKLIHSLKATNSGEKLAPFGYGLHTWFLIDGEPDSWKLQLPVEGIWELDAVNVPTGKILPLERYEALIEGDSLQGHNMDTVFQIGDNPCVAILSKDQVQIRYSGSELFKQWVIFTKGEAQDFICLEPYTWVTNAPNIDQPAEVTGLRGIAPGEALQLEVTLEIIHT
ncbi:aldose 1-epimerase [Paenibacillus agricola]|uniref:Aldose 1-epimerase n=1 Tax=Paenibacillus agricola TaxID=2716264 RepID=A0ABX0JCT8_9BACL|nr:aldose 1-epimerase [Paenibacillus agricola]NHN33591.1 aldose 1-epimerase [Paenibacillus agricola]